MKTTPKIKKNVVIVVIICLFFIFFINDTAYARGGCFGQGTLILTPQGEKLIEQFHQGDRIITYNLTTHHEEKGSLEKIQVISSPDYFLINGKIKVTGTHPFYVQTPTGFNLIEAQYLKIGDRLVGEKETDLIISHINHINKTITVYNLIFVNPNHNFFADGILVHNKGGGGGSGGGTGGGSTRGGSDHPAVSLDNSKTFFKFILAFTILTAVYLPIAFWREIYNLLYFWGKAFTDDPKLIEFTTTVNPNFTNRYSVSYAKDNERWNLMPIASELDEKQYDYIVSKTELIEQFSYLFIQYQLDWTMKDFTKMSEYIVEPFYAKQHNIFILSFGNNFDIVYNPELIEVVPINYKQEQDKHLFEIQVNAKMTNFALSSQGYILSGESFPRSFTEYWEIGLDSQRKWYLLGIAQV